MNINVGDKALVSVDNWFLAPDGRQYRGVFGTIRAVRTDQESLGVKTNSRSTNWYLEIGNMMVAGCQIHYVVRTDDCHAGPVPDCSVNAEAGLREFTRPSYIYFAD